MERLGTPKALTAREMGVVACTRCSKVSDIDVVRCDRCGHRLVSRDQYSLQKVWAFWLVGLMCYIPSNLYPMLKTQTLFVVSEATIVGGAIELAHHGSFGIAFIILLASVGIPVAKFWAVAFLALSVTRRSLVSNHMRMRIFEIVEYVGRWSMIDIFVVAIMSSLVQLSTLASIQPGPASMFFALSVIFTMLSAQAFDPRMIWDVLDEEEPEPTPIGAREADA